MNVTRLSSTIAFFKLAATLLLVAWCLAWGLKTAAAQVADSVPQADVRIIQAPQGAIAPDVMVDGKGVVHMVYCTRGKTQDAFYMQSADNGKTFTRPVKVNVQGEVTTGMGERGPKLALGKNGTIHVVWQNLWFPGAKVFVQHTRSLDGGKTFEVAKAVSSMPGVDGATIAADPAGNVAVFWHVMQPVQKKIPEATWLYVAHSIDDGATFSQDEQVKIKDLEGLACSMCAMRARATGDGNVYLAFRTAVDNIRDFYVLKGAIGGNDFTPVRANNDRWELKTCPMCGPELTFAPDGRVLCAFMSRHKVYWSAADEKLTAFNLHVATPAGEDQEIYPAAVANRKGNVLMVWQVGPMSMTEKATVKWALYSADGKFTGKQGTVGITTSGTKAMAFVAADDTFCLVTTAK